MGNWIRKLTVSVTVILGFLLLTGIAKRVWAQQAVEKRFDQLDQNKYGKITPDELPATELFKRLDLDGNGEITRSEAARALARGKLYDLIKSSESISSDNPRIKQIEAIVKPTDADRDGKITREEAAARYAKSTRPEDRAMLGSPPRRNHHSAMLAVTTAFWDAYLRQDKEAQQWLDSDAVRSVLEKDDQWQTK